MCLRELEDDAYRYTYSDGMKFRDTECIRCRSKQTMLISRLEKLKAYAILSDGNIKCNICGETHIECLEIDQFLSDIFNFKNVPNIYEMFGYFMMPTVKYQKAFILYGPAKTGKTSVINLVSQFIGGIHPEYFISGVSLQELGVRHRLVNLRNKLLNIFDDLKSTILTTSDKFRISVTTRIV